MKLASSLYLLEGGEQRCEEEREVVEEDVELGELMKDYEGDDGMVLHREETEERKVRGE